MSLEHYLELLDWMGRQARRDKRGKIPDDAPPILQRLGLSGPSLVAFVEDFDDLFKHAVNWRISSARPLSPEWLVRAMTVIPRAAGRELIVS